MSLLKSAVFGMSLLAAGAFFASAGAQDARLVGGDKASTNNSEPTIGTLTPAYGMVTLPMSATDPVSYLAGTSSLIQDFAARYSTSIYGGEVGVFARVADRPLLWASEASSAYNLGASVGYAGFYVQGALMGFNDNALMRNFQSWQSWQAGFGYGIGAFDVRLTYSMGEGSAAFNNNRSIDNNQWMLGGIYQLSPGIRFNADAFVGSRFSSPGLSSAQPGTSTPQGTGARVGVQLRF
jgi:hypothetical protein